MLEFDNRPEGYSHPLGATCYDQGVNFSVFSKNATRIDLLLFDSAEQAEPSKVITLDSAANRTFYYWHVFVPGVKAGQLYGYRVYGPHTPDKGELFDAEKLLVDPYARYIIMNGHYSRQAAKEPGNNFGHAMKCAVIDPLAYDWEGDRPLNRPYSETVIYEMHVAGFTKHPSSGMEDGLRGTYKGLIEKIPYLKTLGITAVELMPVQQFDVQDAPKKLTNYWGYSPIGFFAPHNGYNVSQDPVAAANEFRDMVKALHKEGIEVILDVVFNHTAEAGIDGPVISLKGFENKAYYMLSPDKGDYLDYTGCGNTLNANHSIARRMIMDALRAWVLEFHVDGFRFDLASVLSRSEDGEPLTNPPVLWEIESDPVLAGTKIIAEAWDAAGLYQVGSFIGDRWAEWNGKYRDHVRRFIKGDRGMVFKFASKIIASPDVYTDPNREPNRSIHFVTCHDGFTLNDLVSYNDKHNEENGEDNRDGANENHSWNCGEEGPTDEVDIEVLRLRQIKNFIVTTFISQGTPMLLMGDEVRRSQGGNNNAYCQDNEISWFDWQLVDQHADLLEFTRNMIGFAQNHQLFKIDNVLATYGDTDQPHIRWHGTKLDKPDWSEFSHTVSFTMHHPKEDEHIHVMINAYWDDLPFEVPSIPNSYRWKVVVNTALDAPDHFRTPEQAPACDEHVCKVKSRSIVILEGIREQR
jgi:glycogen operon protein